ncbi:glycosyltransferase family 39 protein [Methanolobus sp. ZRKC2]|uniref:glycosyltransferase family 39 protein n=1 Tax=Methanolobus sp. ZRKC2 TaxID=3125783 RepID=UPI0032528234
MIIITEIVLFLAIITGIISIFLYRKELQNLRAISDSKETCESYQKSDKMIIFSVILFTFLGTILIFRNLDTPEFFHDEWWHVSVIKSLQEGFGFKIYDYVTNEPICRYTSGDIFNWIIFQISKLLGNDEFGLRFFVALVGSALIPLIYFTFKDFIGKEPALLTAVMFSFSEISIFLARFLRPYTLFLFCYLLVFFLSYKFLRCAVERKIFNSLLTLFLNILFLIIALDSREFAKILIPLISLYYAGFFLYKYDTKSLLPKYLPFSVISFSLFLIMTIFLQLSGVIDLSIIFSQIDGFFSFDQLSNPTEEYYFYLFELPFKMPLVGYFLFSVGTLLMGVKSYTNRQGKYTYFLIFSLIPLFIMIYLFDRFEDFRYIYFLIPFIYGCMMFGFTWTIKLLLDIYLKVNSLKFNRTYYIVIMLTTLLLFVIFPSIPGININGLTTKSPSDWQHSDGNEYLHQRAVALELKAAYNYMENEKELDSSYALVVTDYRAKYLGEVQFKNVYYLEPYDGENKFYDISTIGGQVNLGQISGETYTLNGILSRNDKVIFVIGPVHMLNEEVFTFLYKKTINHAEQARIISYDYNDFYNGKELYWPNIFVYED